MPANVVVVVSALLHAPVGEEWHYRGIYNVVVLV